MKKGRHHALILAFLLAVMALGIQPVASQTNFMTLAQIAEPFEEMLQGVYVATEWWNQSSDDYDDWMTPYESYDGDDLEYYYEVEDTSGNTYYISDDSEYNYTDDWMFSNLLVMVVLDPDASFMAWLSTYDWSEYWWTDPGYNDTIPEPAEPFLPADEDYVPTVQDIWSLFWNPPAAAMTGDEVFVFSSFYYNTFNYSYSMAADYTWYDESMVEVDANTVIPNLAEEYQWASYMNESWDYADEYSYTYFGYDVQEMTLNGDQVQWMDHYFSGISAFNDTNDNGIMDMVYDTVEIDFDEDGVIDWTYEVMNLEESELVFDFYANDASMGDVQLPYLNDNNQIEWSAEVVDITGEFWSFSPIEACYDVEYLCIDHVNDTNTYQPVTAAVENLEMVYRFEVSDDAAIIKIDQHVGDFTDPITGEAIPEIQGLGMTMNYWSSFTSYGLTLESPTGVVDYDAVPGAAPIEQGEISLSPDTDEFVTISFGGTYVWGADGETYDVGTAIMPGYSTIAFAAEDSATFSNQGDAWSYSTYYYSSCYANWDGSAITHDPIYAVHPNIAPGSVTSMITGVVAAAFLIGFVGLAAMAMVCLRINTERKLE